MLSLMLTQGCVNGVLRITRYICDTFFEKALLFCVLGRAQGRINVFTQPLRHK